MPEEVFVVIVTAMVLGVPILGLTIRMLAKPLAEAITTLKDGFSAPDGISMEDERLMRLEDEVDVLRKTVGRLEEAEEFRKALNAPTTSSPTLPPAPPQE